MVGQNILWTAVVETTGATVAAAEDSGAAETVPLAASAVAPTLTRFSSPREFWVYLELNLTTLLMAL